MLKGMLDPKTLNVPDQFETERLLVRVPVPADAEPFFDLQVRSQDHLRPWMAWAKEPFRLEDTRERLLQRIEAFHNREDFRFLVFRKSDGALMGSLAFNFVDWHTPKAEIGYWIGAEYARQGYTLEAVQGMLDFGFRHLQLHRIEICTDEQNMASRAIPEKLGFTLEAVLRQERRHHLEPERHVNFCIYGLLRPEFENQQA